MAVSMRDVDPAFQGVGQKIGLEIWRIESLHPVLVPKDSHGKFQSRDCYIILKVVALKSGDQHYDIHYWLGKNTSEDEAKIVVIKAVELDAALGGRAVQHREIQGYETDLFLSYFKPFIPEEAGSTSGFKHVEEKGYPIRLFSCKGKYAVHVKEVPYSRSSLNHDEVFILDTKSKIFQFNGCGSMIQERAKALDVVQFIKDNYHDGKCEVASIDDGEFVGESETGEFWGFFGGFAPLSKKSKCNDETQVELIPPRIFCMKQGNWEPMESSSLKKDILDTHKCYLLDCGVEVYVWIGRNTTLGERKNAYVALEKLIATVGRLRQGHVTTVIEGFESVMFKSKFDSWPQNKDVSMLGGRGKVAAMLQRQGLNVGGFLKKTHTKEDQTFIDCSGILKVWRVNGDNKVALSSNELCKFYTGDCYIIQYTYPGDEKENCLLCTWIGKRSIQDDITFGLSLMKKMFESSKIPTVQTKVFEGKEPFQFFTIFNSFVLYKGGLSAGYKNYISENGIDDDTYKDDGVALFKVQGSASDNMQAIQVDAVASSLNSTSCYILQAGTSVYTWMGSLITTDDHDLLERMLDLIKPGIQPKPQKEGAESETFWDTLQGKKDYPSQRMAKDASKDPHLFVCSFSEGSTPVLSGNFQVKEIFNFTQDDLMTEDVMILDCYTELYVWVGQQVDQKLKAQALDIGQRFLEKNILLENPSLETPIFVVMEGGEPVFFTQFFSWNPAKSAMQGSSFQRKLFILTNGIPAPENKPKNRSQSNGNGRSSDPDKEKRSRSTSFSPDRLRSRGRSPEFNALASTFENPNRSESTPPALGQKPYPKSVSPATPNKVALPRSQTIATLTSKFEISRDKKSSSEGAGTGTEKVSGNSAGKPPKPNVDAVFPTSKVPPISRSKSSSMLGISKGLKELEVDVDDGLTLYPYERLTASSQDPVPDIDFTKREIYLSSKEFQVHFGMAKKAFYKLPQWKQKTMKMRLDLF